MNQHAPYRRWLRWSRRTMRDTVNDTRGDLFHQADLWLAATKEPDAPAPGSEQTPTTARLRPSARQRGPGKRWRQAVNIGKDLAVLGVAQVALEEFLKAQLHMQSFDEMKRQIVSCVYWQDFSALARADQVPEDWLPGALGRFVIGLAKGKP